MSSLDVKGAFDAEWWPAIPKGLRDAKCSHNLYQLTQDYFNPLKHSSTKNGPLNRAWLLHGGTKNEPLILAPVHIQHSEPDCEPPFSGLL